MKKVLAIILVAALVLSLGMISVSAEDILYENFEDEDSYGAYSYLSWVNAENTFCEESHTDDGSGCLKSVQNNAHGHVTTIVPMEAGVTYTISCWIKVESTSTGWIALAINKPGHPDKALNPSGNYPKDARINTEILGEWQQLSFEYTPTAEELATAPEGGMGNDDHFIEEGETYSYISLVQWDSAKGTYYWDDITVSNNAATGDASIAVIAVFAVALAAAVVFSKKRAF